MQAVRRRNATGSFTWIGSDGWSARTLVSDGNEREVEGTLSVQPRANPVFGFDEYFFNLSPKNNTRNPWFIGKSLFSTFIPFLFFYFYLYYTTFTPSFFSVKPI